MNMIIAEQDTKFAWVKGMRVYVKGYREEIARRESLTQDQYQEELKKNAPQDAIIEY